MCFCFFKKWKEKEESKGLKFKLISNWKSWMRENLEKKQYTCILIIDQKPHSSPQELHYYKTPEVNQALVTPFFPSYQLLVILISFLIILFQAACIPSILSGKDVVIAAETGSGKTHGYLAPVIDKLCCALNDSGKTDNNQGSNSPHRLSLVLCPNVLLCEQVVQMANRLLGDDGEPLLRVTSVCGRQVLVL